MGRGSEQTFLRRRSKDIHQAYERCLTSLIIREIQIKATMSYLLIKEIALSQKRQMLNHCVVHLRYIVYQLYISKNHVGVHFLKPFFKSDFHTRDHYVVNYLLPFPILLLLLKITRPTLIVPSAKLRIPVRTLIIKKTESRKDW